MNEKLTSESIKYIIARLIDNANDAVGESRKDRNNLFNEGRQLAYYEMLDILQSELSIRDQDLKEFGLDIDLENKIA